MYCTQCGKELKNNDKICKHCRATTNFEEGKEKAGITRDKAVKMGVFVVILLAVMGLIFVNRNDKINVEDIVMASFYGYDTVGEASFYVDEEKIPETLRNTISITSNDTGFLSNGDEIEVRVSYDNTIADEYGIDFSGETVLFTVSGLTELIPIDPFESLTVHVSGISPYVDVSITYSGNNEYITKENFVIENAGFFKNGDTIIIQYQSAMNIAKYGYEVTETKKEYTVEGLREYVGAFEEISEPFLTELKKDASDVITSYTSANYSAYTAKSDLEYVGYVYGVRKKIDGGNYNRLYIIYRSYLSDELNSFEDAYIYYPVKYTNITRLNDAFDADREGIQGFTWDYETEGYRTPSKAYADIVTDAQSLYTITVGDGFENYAENGYIYHASEINDTVLQVLEERAYACAKKYLSTSDDFQWYTVSEPMKVGGYFLVSKNQSGLSNASNKLILVYTSVVSDSEGEQILYLPVIYKNIQIYPNGDFTYESRSLTDEYRGINYWLGNHTQGFIDEALMYSLLVNKYVDDYDEEVFGELKTY